MMTSEPHLKKKTNKTKNFSAQIREEAVFSLVQQFFFFFLTCCKKQLWDRQLSHPPLHPQQRLRLQGETPREKPEKPVSPVCLTTELVAVNVQSAGSRLSRGINFQQDDQCLCNNQDKNKTRGKDTRHNGRYCVGLTGNTDNHLEEKGKHLF